MRGLKDWTSVAPGALLCVFEFMEEAVKGMSDADIQALATYLAGLKPSCSISGPMGIMGTALLGARVLLSSAWDLRAFSDGMR